ncbi:MAG: 50S ribosomal protein L25 [Patescibacteria group bacterium]|nr:50S ribosomal protein L25 [Patescibacteria group bacterium]
MEKLQLKAQGRDIKLNPGKIRKQGNVPAVLYGHNIKNQNLAVSLAEFEKVLKKAGESTLINLTTDDGKNHSVLIHDIQNHYLTSKPLHIDFYEVSMTEKLKSKVALEFTGEARAVRDLGGVLVRVLGEVEVECLPADLPHSIAVDISSMQEFGSTIHVKDLQVPAKVKILTPGEEVIAKVQAPRDVEAELAAPVVEDVTKVEGAAEEKPEEAVKAGEEKAKAE